MPDFVEENSRQLLEDWYSKDSATMKRTVIETKANEIIIQVLLGTKGNFALAEIFSSILSGITGESVETGCGLSVRILWNIGSMAASVLPLPVGESSRTFSPLSIWGITSCCGSVGSRIPLFMSISLILGLSWSKTDRFSPLSSN